MRFTRCVIMLGLIFAMAGVSNAGPVDLASQAANALREGDSALAARLFEEIVTVYPASSEAPRAALRRAYLGLRQQETDSEGLFVRVTAMFSQSTQAADALRRLGYVKQRQGNLEAAQSYFWLAASHPRQTKKGKADSLVNWAYTDISKYFGAGLPDKPKSDGTSAVPSDGRIEATQRLEAARTKFNLVVNTLGNDPDTAAYASFAQAGIGETYILEQQWEEAENAYRAALDNHGKLPAPLKALAHHGLAISYKHSCDFVAALLEDQLALENAHRGQAFLGASSDLIRAEATSVTAVLLMGKQQYAEAVDLLTSTLMELTAAGATAGDLREALARVAAWRVIALHRAGLTMERDAALQDVLRTFPATEAADKALGWSLKYGWG